MRVPVLVSATFIEDGEAQPAVGQTVTYRTRFAEVDEEQDPDPDLCRWWTLTANPVGEPYRSRPLGGEPQGPWFWPTVLHGPGWSATWSATWSAPRRVHGEVSLRGQLSADYDFSTLDTTIGGTIDRVRIVTQAETPGTLTTPGRLVPRSRAYHDVDTSPLAFHRGPGRVPALAPEQPVPTSPAADIELPPDARVSQIGVVVDVLVRPVAGQVRTHCERG